MHTPHAHLLGRLALAGLTSLMMSACGGGASGPAGTTPAAASTTIQGQVVKGPVNGAQVCAYTVSSSGPGTALGNCTNTDAQGAYTLSVPVGTGAVWIAATGGSYTDEATGSPTSLPAGAPMTAVVDATGGNATAMVTPLTTLAVNTARQVAGASAVIDEAAVRQAVAQVRTALSLPAGLDLLGAAPVVGSNANAYGQALAAVSKMVQQGTSLQSVLNGTDASSFSAAFASAVQALQGNGGGTGGGTDTGGGTGGGTGGTTTVAVTATGTVVVGTGSFTPDATGFEVSVESNMAYEVSYRFYRRATRQQGNVTITDTQMLEVTRNRYINDAPYTYRFTDSTGALPNVQCSSQCDVRVSTAAGTTHPVSITIGADDATEPVRGTLVGDAEGAWWSFTDAPATTASALQRNGVATTVRTVQISDIGTGSSRLLSISLELDNGALLSLSQQGTQAATATYNGNGFEFCFSNCGVTLSSAAGVTHIGLQGTTVGSSTFHGTVTVDSTRSTVSSTELGSFTAVSDALKSVNDVRTLLFSADATLTTPGITSVSVASQAGVVTRVDVGARQASGFVTRSCGTGLGSVGIGACTGITLGSDGRTVSFADTALFTAGLGSPGSATARLNGTLVARGR